MKQPHKKGFVAFTVLALIMFAGLITAFELYAVLVLKSGIKTVLKTLYLNKAMLKYVLSFKLPFESISWIVGALFALLFLALLVISIICIKKKPAAKVFGILLSLFGVAVSAVFVTALYHNVIWTYSVRDYFDNYYGVVAHFQNAFKNAPKIALRQLAGALLLLAEVGGTLLYLLFGSLAIVKAIKYSRAALSKDEEVPAEAVEEPAEEEAPVPEPEEAAKVEDLPVFIPEPEEEPIDPRGMSTTALAAIIKDVVREIVRDELERNNLLGKEQPLPQQPSSQSVVGATFGGPLIVQYFNGGIQSAVPAPAPEPVKEEPKPAPQPEPVKEEPKPEPVKEEPKPEPAPVVEEPAPAPVVEEPKPAPVPAPAPVEKQPKAPIVRIPFEERLLGSEKELQDLYSELKNEILSYGVKSRVSSSGDTFRLHRKTYIKLTVAGKSLKLYFALNPDDYRDSPIPVQDAGGKSIYAEIPLVFKVKSALSVRRCKQLIQDVMERDGLEQGEIGQVNWIKELKAEMKARKSEKK